MKIVFEPLITLKKKKWARKDEIFAEEIAQQFDIIHTGQDYFPEEKDHFELIKEEFVYKAEFLEREAQSRKITSKELKAAIKFFKFIINRVDFTKQNYKEVVDKGQDFIWIEMKKVEPLCTSTFVECAVINVILYYVDRVGLNTQYRAESGREDPVGS